MSLVGGPWRLIPSLSLGIMGLDCGFNSEDGNSCKLVYEPPELHFEHGKAISLSTGGWGKPRQSPFAPTAPSTDEEFSKMALSSQLDETMETTREWMALVEEKINEQPEEMNGVERMLRGVDAALREYGVIYRAGAGANLFVKDGVLQSFRDLNEVLISKGVDCREASSLVAATLLLLVQKFELKKEVVLITTTEHVVAALVSDSPKEGTLKGVPFDDSGQTLYLFPFEATRAEGAVMSPEKALAPDKVKAALNRVETRIVRVPDGRILFYNEGDGILLR